MKTVLIIGPADTSYGINVIMEQDSVKIVEGLYGEFSALTQAFKCFNGIQNVKIFLANAQYKNDYINIINTARHSELDFIVPLGIKFSDQAPDRISGQQYAYTELLLKALSETSETILVMTDNHASLYEDIDHYLKDMFKKIRNFKNQSKVLDTYGRQLWFVANNLKNVTHANALLVAAICHNKAGNYPLYDFPEALFHIDPFDVDKHELIYFRNNAYAYTSIENFRNYCIEECAEKFIPIDLVIREIDKGLDLSKFCGKLLSNVTKLKIRTEVIDYLDSIKGFMIRDYEFLDVIIELKANYTYRVTTYFNIYPNNTLEKSLVVITT